MADLLGFDVSKWQGGAWNGSGDFTFGVVKLTEGVGYKDSAADRHMAAILAQPIVPGGYHFARPDLNPGTSGAYAEADWFWAVASSYGGAIGMLLAHDAESAGGSASWCQDFAGRLFWRSGGYNTIFYSFWAWMTSRGIVGSDVLARSALWLAWPDANGALPGPAVSMQQWGLTSVPGISGGVDANRFFGTLPQLEALTVGGGAGGLTVAQIDDLQRQLGDVLSLLLFGSAAAYADPAKNPNGWSAPDGKGHLTRAYEGMMASQGAALTALGVEKAEVDALLAGIRAPAVVDMVALLAGLVPHLQVIDEVALLAHLDTLPPATAAAVKAGFAKALAG
jgi:lysozyme